MVRSGVRSGTGIVRSGTGILICFFSWFSPLDFVLDKNFRPLSIDQYRVCFTWDGNDAFEVEITDYH